MYSKVQEIYGANIFVGLNFADIIIASKFSLSMYT